MTPFSGGGEGSAIYPAGHQLPTHWLLPYISTLQASFSHIRSYPVWLKNKDKAIANPR